MNAIKTFLLLASVLCWHMTHAQDCTGLVKNQKDEFTGELVKESKTRITTRKGYEEAYIQIDQYSDSLKLTFIYSNSTTRLANAAVYRCQKGDKMFLLLEDDSVIKLDLLGESYSPRTEDAGVVTEVLLGKWAGLAKSNKVLFEPEYMLDMPALQSLSLNKVKKIRVEAKGMKSDTGQPQENIEISIEELEAKQLLSDIKCLLK